MLPLLFFAAAIPVWIDADPSVMRGGHEVDDGFALIQAFHSPELAIRGVSIVGGNAPYEQALVIGREMVSKFGPKGLAVSDGLAAALRREKLTVFALGPATNIAKVLKEHPELTRRITRIIAVAGRRPGQRFSPAGSKQAFRDFNFDLDPQAFQTILDSRVPLTLAPWEISSKVWLDKADMDRLRPGNPGIEYLYEPVRDWLAKWKAGFGTDAFNPFDTLAIGYLTARKGYTCEMLPATIESHPDDTGAAGNKPYFLVAQTIRSKYKVEYCSDAGPGFKQHLLDRLAHRSNKGEVSRRFD